MTRVKICGLTRPCDIDYVNEARPAYIGFVFAPSRRRVTFSEAEALRKRLDDGILPVGVFADSPPADIAALAKAGIIGAVQLHGRENAAYLAELKRRVSCPLIRAVRVETAEDTRRAAEIAADFLLLDSGAGGTGRRFDWNVLNEARPLLPFFLAGGLNPGNVGRAVRDIRPFAVDVSSGAESDGAKDFEKIKRICETVRRASDE